MYKHVKKRPFPFGGVQKTTFLAKVKSLTLTNNDPNIVNDPFFYLNFLKLDQFCPLIS